MKDKQLVLVKILLAVDAIAFGAIASYFIFDNIMYKLAFGTAWIALIAFRNVLPAIQNFTNKTAEFIFCGVQFTLPFILTMVTAMGFFVFFTMHDELGYFFFGLSFFSLAINEVLRIVVFDYQQNVVTGLRDSEKLEMKGITPRHMTIKLPFMLMEDFSI